MKALNKNYTLNIENETIHDNEVIISLIMTGLQEI